MKHYAPRKYRGPGVWALVRDAYLAGETGPIVAARYDVGLANLRRRAALEGWSRAHLARAADRASSAATRPAPPPEPAASSPKTDPAAPDDPVRAALDRAAAQLAAGRGAEAASTLKAAETLRRLLAEIAGGSAAAKVSAADSPHEEVGRWEALREMIEARADGLARGLLQSQFPGVPAVHSPFVLHWRALHLGPEAARRDREHATHAGWARRVYAPDGVLRPLADLLADERRRLWSSWSPDAAAPDLPLSETPDPLPPDPDTPPPAWTGPIIREL